MPAIQFPASSAPGRNRQEGAGRLINAMVEKLGDGARNPTVWTRVPGMQRFASIDGFSHTRGLFFTGSQLIHVTDDRIFTVDSAGNVNNLGSLSGSKLVTIAQNIRTPIPDIVAVTENGAFTLSTSAAPTSYAAPDLPIPNSVVYLGGYFIFTVQAGQIWASGFQDTSVDALSFTNTAARSDILLRGIAFRNEFFAFGQSSIEVYNNQGTIPFPLGYVTMIPRGLAGQFAVAGWEEGWSNELIWVADDNIVYKLNGYSPQTVSTHDVERSIESVADKSTLQAFVFTRSGHPQWALKSADWTWVYDLRTGQWHERQSHNSDHWRASCSVKAWDKWIVGDEATGHLFEVTDACQYEDSNPLVFEVESSVGASFPSRFAVPRADFDFTVGVGKETGIDPIEVDPKVLISWSDNAGADYSTPLVRNLGKQGNRRTRVVLNRTGYSGPAGRVWKVSCSDPVHIGLLGGSMEVEERAP